MTRLLVFLVVFVVGCPDAGSRPPGDAQDATAPDTSLQDATVREMGPDAVAAPDATLDTGPVDCSEVAGLRRCDLCPEGCSVGETCRGGVGVCAPRDTDTCSFSVFPGGGEVCSTGSPCAGRWTGDVFGGSCVSAAFCLEARDAGLPFEACLYPDGTPLMTGPPDAVCPTSSDPRAPFCGGACDGTACPAGEAVGAPIETVCLGLAETRGFGVCAFTTVHCHRDYAYEFNCEENYGEPCACMVLEPQPELQTDAPNPVGFFVMASACRAYRAEHPDTVECLDQNWNPL